MSSTPKVFISYAWENQNHQDRVLALGDRLEQLGIEVILDQYEPNPNLGWPKWMQIGVESSDFVLSICTPKYKERVEERQQPGEGLGAQWEGSLIYNHLYYESEHRNKFQVIQFNQEIIGDIPLALRGTNRFVMKQFELQDSNFEALYRVLTDQPKTQRPQRGEIQYLVPRKRQSVPRSGNEVQQGQLSIFDGDMGDHPIQFDQRSSRLSGNPSGRGTYLERQSAKLIGRSWEAIERHDYQTAYQLSLKGLSINGNVHNGHMYAGFSARELGNYTDAINHFEKAINSSDNQDRVRMYLLACKVELSPDRLEEMLVEANNIYENPTQSVNMAWEYGHFLISANKPEVAEHFLRLELAKNPTDPSIIHLLAFVLWKTNRVIQAFELLEAADKSKFAPITWIDLGIARAESGRFGLAIDAIHKAVALAPGHLFATYALAEIYGLLGDIEACLFKLRELIPRRAASLKRIKTEPAFRNIVNTPAFKEFIDELTRLDLV